MSIHQATSQGRTSLLRNVHITSLWELDASGQRERRSAIIEDGTGSIRITFWGKSAHAQLIRGATYTISCPPGGRIESEEYQGKKQLSAEGVTFRLESAPEGTEEPTVASPVHQGTRLTQDSLRKSKASAWALLSKDTYEAFLDQGFPEEVAHRAALMCHGWKH